MNHFRRKQYAETRDLLALLVKTNACSYCRTPFKLVSNYGAMYPLVFWRDNDLGYFCSEECLASSPSSVYLFGSE
jgi:hypothetical protein